MTRRHFSTLSVRGSWSNPTCSGGSETGLGGAQSRSFGMVRKDVTMGDGFTPTDYSCLWSTFQDGTQTGIETLTPCPPGELGKPWIPRYRTHQSPVMGTIRQPSGFGTFNGDFIIGTPPAANFTHQRLNLVVDAAILQKILDQKLSLGVTLGEAKESINLALDLAEDLVSVVKWVKTGIRHPGQFINYMLTKPKGRPNLNGKPHWSKYAKTNDVHSRRMEARMPKWKQESMIRSMSKKQLADLGLLSHAAANRWLQVRYGVTPCYNDLLKILEECRKGRANEADNLVSARVTIPFVPGQYSGSTVLRPTYHTPKEGEKSFQQMKVWFKVSDPKARDLVQRGLHPLQLSSVVWELTPFSFMLDWMIPVGDTLSALAATVGITFVTGYRSQKSVMNLKVLSNDTGTGFKWSMSDKDAGKITVGAFHRVPLTKFPSIIQYPTVENPYGVHTGQRITDTVSILYQMTGKSFRASKF